MSIVETLMVVVLEGMLIDYMYGYSINYAWTHDTSLYDYLFYWVFHLFYISIDPSLWYGMKEDVGIEDTSSGEKLANSLYYSCHIYIYLLIK